jgi:hypothetical protein
MTEVEMVHAVEFAMRFRLRNLRPVLWKKHLTLATIVELQPVGLFAREVAEFLI